ncbi:MAG: helix-turn-helix transcriptional regulator [Acidimicrobiia bacterium]
MTATELGQAIRRRRKSLHLTQQDLADLVGVNRRSISELERGTGGTSLRTVIAVCQALGMAVTVQPVTRHAS